ncbi:MAG TPA: ABC transporter permease, partial [Microlunatus sp.]|nr:ABC transporter permease [Microlunatus sp.]
MSQSATTVSLPKGGNAVQGFFSELTRSKVGFFGFVLVALIVGMTIIAPLVVNPDNPTDLDKIWGGPSLEHPLGTDGSGKDTLKQILLGGQTVVFVGFAAAGITTVIAVVIGSLAAYFRGRFDAIMLQITDIVMTVPQIVLLAVMGAFFRLDSPVALAVLIGVLSWPVLMRSIRAQVL